MMRCRREITSSGRVLTVVLAVLAMRFLGNQRLCRDTLLALRALTTVLADCRPTALLALRAYTIVLTYRSPAALLALRAHTTVLAYL
jgi:hypothetical protein